MSDKLVFVYSGQGSHYFHMGQDLYQSNDRFRQLIDQYDRAANALIGYSPMDITFDPSKKKYERFDDPLTTSFSIFIIERAVSRLLSENGLEPDTVVGISMGSFAAAVQSKVFDDNVAMELLFHQVKTVSKYAKKGGLIAVLDNFDNFKNCNNLQCLSEVAAYNYEGNFVIGYKYENRNAIVDTLASNKISFQELSVSLPYHTSYIESAEERYKERFSCYQFNDPEKDFICCANEGIKQTFDSQSFWEIVRNPIRFASSVNCLDVNKNKTIFIDVGPAGSSFNFLKNIYIDNPSVSNYQILSPFSDSSKNLSFLFNFDSK